MSKRLENKVAVVTGASTGIGYASVNQLAKEGAQVVCLDVSDKLDSVVENLNKDGYKVIGLKTDISKEEQVKSAVETIKNKFGKVDILFNNAGIDRKDGRLHEYSVENFDEIINVDLRGTFLVTKYIIPLMLKDGGSIVNTSSFSGLAADLNRAGYNAAKAGVINLTKSIAIEYGRDNIRANAIAPGTIETPLVDNLAGTNDQKSGSDFRNNQKWVTPLGRLGKPEEVAKLVAFLASDDSSFITGETITIDGGVMAYTWPGEMLYDQYWKDSMK